MTGAQAFGWFLVRLTCGLMIAAHGAMKVVNWESFSAKQGVVLALLAIAGELGGGLGIATGVLARVAGFGVAAVMLYIAFTVHPDAITAIGTGNGTKFEYPFLAGVIGLAVLIAGPGPWSLEQLVRGRT